MRAVHERFSWFVPVTIPDDITLTTEETPCQIRGTTLCFESGFPVSRQAKILVEYDDPTRATLAQHIACWLRHEGYRAFSLFNFGNHDNQGLGSCQLTS